MKKNLFVAIVLSTALFSCRPKVIYVDRPVSDSGTNTTAPAAAPADNQPYQPPVNNTPPPAVDINSGNTQSYNGNQSYDNNQQYNGYQQYNNNAQYNTQESDQQYYANQQQVNYAASSYQTFYDELSPYGSWVNYPGYGYAWVPAQGVGFTPYSTNGYWTYTQYGATWVSNYSWGWAPFHYGRWTLDNVYGWVWIPGNTWAPAWVTWGHSNGYYGWAPLGPGVYNYEGYRPPVNHWCFVPENRIVDHDVNNYVVNHNSNTTIVNNVVIINNNGSYNNSTFCAGPLRNNVETSVGHSVQTVVVNETSTPYQGKKLATGNTLNIYRPAISQATAARAMPTHIVPIENVRTVNATAVHGVVPAHSTIQMTHTSGGSTANPAVRPSNQVNEGRPIQAQPQGRQMEERPQSRPTEAQPPSRPIEANPASRPTPSRPIEAQPQSRPIEERPQSRPSQERPIQAQPQSRPTEERPQSQPQSQPRPIERRPEPVQHQPAQIQNRPVAKPRPQGQPARPAPQHPVEKEHR